jgi:phage terminase small subunit
MSEDIPLPKKLQHQAFADLVLAGHAPATAYQMAGFAAKTSQSRATASGRLLKNVDIADYIAAVKAKAQSQMADDAMLTVLERRGKLARIYRANILKIDPTNPDDPNADLLKKVKIREKIDVEGNVTRTTEFEIHDALAAGRDDGKLSGDDPEANAMQQMAEALERIAKTQGTLPDDKM